MMKGQILGLVTTAMLVGPVAAQAFTYSFDDPDQSVARPASGSTVVTYSGPLTLQPGEFIFSVNYQADQNLIAFVNLFNPSVFSISVTSETPFGLYTGTYRLTSFSSTNQPDSQTFSWSLNVLNPNAVPEPGSLALLGLGLAGLGLMRRRNAD